MINSLFYIWCILNMLLFIYVFHEVLLMIRSLIPKHSNKLKVNNDDFPYVTIQLPMYNEKYVVKRLLDAVRNIDYPIDKMEVQVLDDSTDDTTEIIEQFIEGLGDEDFNFHLVRREDRKGYKAGALAYGMQICKGEFIAIFDADFIPDDQFLKRTIPSFKNPSVGVVQTRWTHINSEQSFLTKAQSIMLNTHFCVEQLGRSNADSFINFNGTAGIWRKECIIDSGGWQSDTLTEDLDLSFRAQTRGWRFEYLFDVESPAELPVTFEAFRTQQFRWSKGAAECLRKNFTSLWKAPISLKTKLIGTFHLLNSSVYLLVVAIFLLSPIVFYLNAAGKITVPNKDGLTVFGASVIYLLFVLFFVGNIRASSNKLKDTLLFVPSILIYFAMTTGISVYMVVGVIEGYLGKKSPFVRTPKFGETNLLNKVKKGYDFKKETPIVLVESLFLLYGIFWLFSAFIDFNFMSVMYGMIILVGFSFSLFFKKRTFQWRK